jgi:F-type H+-transporting ATPase subunit alpha
LVRIGRKQVSGMALNLEKNSVGCLIFGNDQDVRQNDTVEGLGRLIDVGVGEALLGRVVNGLGLPIDGKGNFDANIKRFRIERKAPGVITRQSVHQPLLTGYKVIDSMFPIGRGQRELIIGDRQTGKTTIAVDTILSQKHLNKEDIEIFCVYVGIGQKKSSILNLKQLLEEHNALRYTTIVAATAAESAALQYIAPYTGCSIAEYFRDSGQNALIVYDDLTKHAAAYRQLALLLRRPAGREAFPADVFYAHSRLLERACKLNERYGSGSLTALPIVETQAGDLSGYIPTNVISITDGQIYLERDLFFKGIRPAVNVGSSVSRVGSRAQPFALRLATGNLRFELAQYREYQIFAQFDSDIDEVTKGILAKGNLLTEVLKQGPHAPLELYQEVIIILGAVYGFITPFVTDIKQVGDVVSRYEAQLYNYLTEGALGHYLKPLFSLLHFAESGDFDLDNFPLVFSLASFDLDLFLLPRKT